MHKLRIGGGHRQMTSPRPPDRRSWSPRAPKPSCRTSTLAARVSRDRHHRRSHPCLAWQLLLERVAPHGSAPPLSRRGHRRSPASRPWGRRHSPAMVPRRRSPFGSGIRCHRTSESEKHRRDSRSRNRYHRTSGSGSHRRRPGVSRYARSRAIVVIARALEHL
jgi:hypothetical protein